MFTVSFPPFLLRNMSWLWILSCERAQGVNATSCATRVSLEALVKLSETGRRQIKPTQVSLCRRRSRMLAGWRVFRASGCVTQVSARGMRGMRER